jgi:hypothetical protein
VSEGGGVVSISHASNHFVDHPTSCKSLCSIWGHRAFVNWGLEHSGVWTAATKKMWCKLPNLGCFLVLILNYRLDWSPLGCRILTGCFLRKFTRFTVKRRWQVLSFQSGAWIGKIAMGPRGNSKSGDKCEAKWQFLPLQALFSFRLTTSSVFWDPKATQQHPGHIVV